MCSTHSEADHPKPERLLTRIIGRCVDTPLTPTFRLQLGGQGPLAPRDRFGGRDIGGQRGIFCVEPLHAQCGRPDKIGDFARRSEA
jgi:hypothetical protein